MLRVSVRKASVPVRRRRFAFALLGLAAGAGCFLGNAPTVEAGGGFCHGALAREGNDGTVTLEGFCFSPTVMRVTAHTVVNFRNTDPVPHLVTGVANSWGSIDETLAPNTSKNVAFDAPGMYPYTCLLHPGMTGVIVVGDGVFASSPGVPSIRALSASSVSAQPELDPGLRSAAISAASSGRSHWFYAGIGAFGGLAVAGVGFGVASARRSSRS